MLWNGNVLKADVERKLGNCQKHPGNSASTSTLAAGI